MLLLRCRSHEAQRVDRLGQEEVLLGSAANRGEADGGMLLSLLIASAYLTSGGLGEM
jgi:hypothetical protein